MIQFRLCLSLLALPMALLEREYEFDDAHDVIMMYVCIYVYYTHN